jgi:hypothetical protein
MCDPPFAFSINGRSVTPQHYSLNDDPSVMAPGDVIRIGEGQFNYGALFMTLGEERDCRFVTIEPETVNTDADDWFPSGPMRDGRVFLELPDGRRKVVGAMVTKCVRSRLTNADGPGRDISFEEFPVKPLETMSPEDIHGLWGIYLSQWPEGIEEQLAHVKTERVCITLNDHAGVGGKTPRQSGPVFPPIPVKTRYLVVKKAMSPGLRDFTRLGQFRDLAFLIFQSGGSREVLDADLISRNTSLRYFDVSRGHIENCQELASLTNLRFLNVGGFSNMDRIRNIEFVRGMRQLRVLDIHGTRVSSLSPLDGSDSIREVRAGGTKVRRLPRGDLCSLRSINLISTRVNTRTVARFRASHPTCKVEYGWGDSLRTAVAEATRLRVRSGGTCHRDPDEEETLVEVGEAEEIGRFLTLIDIDENGSGGGCLCCGNPTFEFYAGDRLLAMVGYHRDSLRWAGGAWTGDGILTKAGQAAVGSWLIQHGLGRFVPRPEDAKSRWRGRPGAKKGPR